MGDTKQQQREFLRPLQCCQTVVINRPDLDNNYTILAVGGTPARFWQAHSAQELNCTVLSRNVTDNVYCIRNLDKVRLLACCL